jgi:hypothetical protein
LLASLLLLASFLLLVFLLLLASLLNAYDSIPAIAGIPSLGSFPAIATVIFASSISAVASNPATHPCFCCSRVFKNILEYQIIGLYNY